jgi:zinc protease
MTTHVALSSTLIPPESVHATTLGNGLRVLIRRDASAPVVAIVTHVRAGYFDEPDEVVGIAHVLEHMYFKGTPSRGVGEIAKETKAAGGYLNAGTIYDHTSYYTVLPASGFAKGLEIQADAYANSTIDADELARELEVIIQEVKRKEDNPAAVAVETLYEILHDRHRIRRWRMGREEGLRRLTREDLLRFYRTFYQPENTTLSIVGDVDPDQALREVELRYGSLARGRPPRDRGPAEGTPAGFRFREWEGDVARTQIALGWRSPPLDHPDTPLLDLAAATLGSGRGSRLYRAVRERKLASMVAAFNYTPTDIGIFTIQAEAPPESAAPALEAIWAQVAELGERIGDGEIHRAKRVYEARWIRSLEDMEGQANHLAEWESLGDWRRGDRYLEQVLAATPEDVRQVVRKHLAADQAAIGIYRPVGAPEVAGDAKGARSLLMRGASPAPLPVPPGLETRKGGERRSAGLESTEGKVRVYRSTSGVPILVRLKPGARMIHFGIFFAGGAIEEDAARSGITSLMVRTAAKGTARATAEQIAHASELLGGSISGSTATESFGWTIAVPSHNYAAAAGLLAEVVQGPALTDDHVNTERALAISEIVAQRDDMFRYPLRLLQAAAFAGHPYGRPVSGTEQSLSSLAAAEVRDWHAQRVLGGAPVVAVVGDGDAEELANVAASTIDSLTGGHAGVTAGPEWPAGMAVVAEEMDKAQTALAMAFPAPALTSDRRYAAGLLATVASGLGGRFFDELRDRQSLCYTVHAYHLPRRSAGAFVAYIATSPEKEEIARAGLLREFQRFRDEPVSPEELERAQRYATGSHAIAQQSGSAVLGEVVEAWLLGRLGELDGYEEAIRSVDRQAMASIAEECFEPSIRAEGIVRGKRTSG